jgi:coenzyme F420-reducing hydrogenase gamma subunit
MVSKGIPCLGPVTQAGCGAICPSFNRGCYACFGPSENPNTSALSGWWNEKLGVQREDLVRAFRSFNAYAEAFRVESETHER